MAATLESWSIFESVASVTDATVTLPPGTVAAIIEGFRAWLAAIPDEIVALMAAGYLGYTGARSLDKRRR